MGRPYKDGNEYYAYEIPLHEGNYYRRSSFTCESAPGDFIFPEYRDGWSMRKAIKEWAEKQEWLRVRNYKIVRANGYWRDLHGDFVYELWVKHVGDREEFKGQKRVKELEGVSGDSN